MLHTMIFDNVSCKTKDKALKRIPYFKKSQPKPLRLTTDEIIDKIKHGFMYTTVELKQNRQKNHAVHRSVFAIDIDNNNIAVSFTDLKRLFDDYHIHMFLAYKTYSVTKTEPDYRILLAFNKPYGGIYVTRIYKALQLLIDSKYNGCVNVSYPDNYVSFPCVSDNDVLFEDPLAQVYLFQIHDIYQTELKRNINRSNYLRYLKQRLNGLVIPFLTKTTTKFSSILVLKENILNKYKASPIYECNEDIKKAALGMRANGSLSFSPVYESNEYTSGNGTSATKSIELVLAKNGSTKPSKSTATKTVMKFLAQLDIRKLFGLDSGVFPCILRKHAGVRAFASIKKNRDGEYFYVCGTNSLKRLTLIDLVQKLLQEVTTQFEVHPIDAYFWIIGELKLTTDNIRFRLANAYEYKKMIGNARNLSRFSQPIHKVLTRASGIHLKLFNYILDNAIRMGYQSNRFKLPYLYFSASIRYIMEHLSTKKKYSYGSIQNSIKLLVHLGLIEKVPDTELSKYMYDKLMVGDKKMYKRHVTLFRIPVYSPQLIQRVIDYLTGKNKTNLSSDSSISKRYYKDDKPELKRHFGQYKDMCELNDTTISIQERVYRFILGHIQKERYVSVQNLIKYVMSLKSCSITTARVFVSSFLPKFIDIHGLYCEPYKKKLSERFCIKESLHSGTSKIIYKI